MRNPVRPSPLWIPLIALVVVAALLLWTWPQDLSPLRTGGIVIGWVGCGLLLTSLLLMLREPRLAQWLGGLESMYRWHHWLGAWAYLALLVHPLALAADAWSESPALAWATLAPWQQGWAVWSGWVSLVCMMAGLLVALWPRLSYAAWRKLHQLLALSALVGAAHLVLLGLDGVLLVVPVLILALLLWRVFRADRGMGAVPYVVRGVEHLSPATVEVTLQPLARPLGAQPGQFVLAAFEAGPGFRGCGEYHPYTISALGADGRMGLGIKALGDCTRQLQQVQPGTEARVQGPFGRFLADGVAGPSLWVAGGIGITPFVAALRNGPLAHPVRLIYLHRDHAGAPYADELTALAATQPLLHLHVVDASDAVPDLGPLLPAADELRGLHCHLCGPAGLLDAAVRLLRERGVAASRIHFERFDFR